MAVHPLEDQERLLVVERRGAETARTRLVVHIAYPFGRALVKFVGTHEEYDKIDPETV